MWNYLQANEVKRKADGGITRNQAEELTKKLGVLLDIGTSVPGKDAFFPGMKQICLACLHDIRMIEDAFFCRLCHQHDHSTPGGYRSLHVLRAHP